MSESFEGVMAFARKISDCEFGEHPNDSIREWCEIYDCGTCTVCLNRLLDRLKRAHEHEVEHAHKAEYNRGYEDGRRSMDAEHRAVALRLQQLPLDEDSHGNLNQIARAIWHSDWGWTQGACRGLRDELIRLLGGVHDEPVSVGEPSDADCDDCHRCDGESGRVSYDELGNERNKVVCALRRWIDTDGEFYPEIFFDELFEMLGCEERSGKDAGEQMCDRLIHLLGGDECNFSGAKSYMDAMGEKSNPAEMSDASTDHVSFDTRLKLSTYAYIILEFADTLGIDYPNGSKITDVAVEIRKRLSVLMSECKVMGFAKSAEIAKPESEDGGEATITDELVKYAVDRANDPKGYYEFTNTDVGLLVCISQHIDAEYANLMAERDKLLRKFDVLKEHGIEVVDAVAGGYEIYSEDHKKVDQLKYERDELRAELDELRGHSRTCPESGDGMSMSASSVSITDELRECVYTATKTYDDTPWHEIGEESESDHTICYITEGELLRIADRIDEWHKLAPEVAILENEAGQ